MDANEFIWICVCGKFWMPLFKAILECIDRMDVMEVDILIYFEE